MESRKIVIKEAKRDRNEKFKPGKIIRSKCPSCKKDLQENGTCCIEGNNMAGDLCPECHSGGIDLQAGVQSCPCCDKPYFVELLAK